MKLSDAQSPFAQSKCYFSCQDVSHLVSRIYPAFITPTNSCVYPKPSSCLEFNLVHQVFAGCCQPLLGVAYSRRYLCQSFSTCLDPYSGALKGACIRFFPLSVGLLRSMSGSAVHFAQQLIQLGGAVEAAVIR